MKNGLIIRSDESKLWYKDDRLHKIDGPAIIYKDGGKCWYYYGKHIHCSSTKEFLRLIKLKAFW